MADATGVMRDGQPYANAYVFAFEMTGLRVRRMTGVPRHGGVHAVWDRVEQGPGLDGQAADMAAKS